VTEGYHALQFAEAHYRARQHRNGGGGAPHHRHDDVPRDGHDSGAFICVISELNQLSQSASRKLNEVAKTTLPQWWW
jgi:hypothetical protein